MKTKQKLILLGVTVPALAIALGLGIFILGLNRPAQLLQSMPANNGYPKFAIAAQSISPKTSDFVTMDKVALSALTVANGGSLSLVRSGLSNECRVTLQFSQSWQSNHMAELSGVKSVAQAFLAEGTLAEMEDRPGDAASSYLDAIRFGNESARGGVLIDSLVGMAVESLGVTPLQKLSSHLDAKTCRESLAILIAIDAKKQSSKEVLQQEKDWSRGTLTGFQYLIYRPFRSKSAMAATGKFEGKYNAHERTIQQLLITLSVRAYELEKGYRPRNLADLVPDYLKNVPQDPLTGTPMTYTP